jgi:hypothetical protein
MPIFSTQDGERTVEMTVGTYKQLRLALIHAVEGASVASESLEYEQALDEIETRTGFVVGRMTVADLTRLFTASPRIRNQTLYTLLHETEWTQCECVYDLLKRLRPKIRTHSPNLKHVFNAFVRIFKYASEHQCSVFTNYHGVV